MKCPNCSFVNSDDTKNCKVCGYELEVVPKVSTPKKRVIDASEEEALDTALKSLFGLDAKKTTEEEDPLDVAAVERMLKKKRPIQSANTFESPSISDSIDDETIEDDGDVLPLFDSDEPEERPNRKLIIIIIASALVVLLLIFFNSNLSHKLWKYNSNNATTEIESTEAIATEETTEAVFSLGDADTLEPVNAFFNALPAFVNQGNLSILSLFSSSQDALDVLTAFAIIGNVEKIASGTLENSEVTEESATYVVNTTIDRLIDGQQKQVPILWDFRVVKSDSGWQIQSFSIDSETLSVATSTEETTTATTEASTEVTTEAKTEATTETTTVATTEAKLDGFTSSGGFSGGTSATGQDIASARYGNHQSFERIVFDIYEWIGGQPTTTVDNIGAYAAIISEDGKTIRINVNGALDAYADNLTLDLKGSANIQSVQYANSGNGEMVTIVIHLAKPSQYKVFSLKLPAKLVVDIAIAD